MERVYIKVSYKRNDVVEEQYFNTNVDTVEEIEEYTRTYESDGFEKISEVVIPREDYVSWKLDRQVEDYLRNESYESEIKKKFGANKMDAKTFFDSLRLIADYRITCFTIMDMYIADLLAMDAEVTNEVALQIYDMLHGRIDAPLN